MARMRVFCFPYAGGGPSAFRGWANGIRDVEFCFVHPPGRENRIREKPFSDMRLLVEALTTELAGWLDRPYALYGHSLGGVVAFEFARAARQLGWREPSHLFVSASRAPHLPARYPKVHHLEDLELLSEVNRRYGGVPLQLMHDPELRQLLVPCLRADLALLETYDYVDAEPLDCQITCFGATGDRMVTEDVLRPWSTHSKRELQLHMVSGGHLFLQSARSTLLDKISAALAYRVPNAPALSLH
jgi:medium-chain acyl-[acyl-carrier-protein] hydrolase